MEKVNHYGQAGKICGFSALLLSFSQMASAAGGAADFAVEDIDASKLVCNQNGSAYVEVSNRGGDLRGGYNLQVQLRVSPPRGRHKDYKTTIAVPRSGRTEKIKFDRINITPCVQEASNFEAKINLLGGNYREGNTRNNQLRKSFVVANRGGTNNQNGQQGDSSQGNYPDFSVSRVSPLRNACYGDKHNVSVTVNNQGYGNYRGNPAAELVVTGPDGKERRYQQGLGKVQQNRSRNVTFRNVEFAQQGKYSYAVMIDSKENIPETDERNNTYTGSFDVKKPCGNQNGGNNAGGAPDYEVVDINTDNLRCGSSCSVQNKVGVVIRNKGRAPGGGYSLQVNLHVTPGGGPANAKRHREMIKAPGAGETVTVIFDRINIPSCSQRASNFEADINLSGGNYREGNTRNNQLRKSETIRKRC